MEFNYEEKMKEIEARALQSLRGKKNKAANIKPARVAPVIKLEPVIVAKHRFAVDTDNTVYCPKVDFSTDSIPCPACKLFRARRTEGNTRFILCDYETNEAPELGDNDV